MRTLSIACMVWLLGAPAAAQDRDAEPADASDPLGPLFEGLDDDDDPLSVGSTADLSTVEAAPERPPSSEHGETLSAIPGVREVDHDITVRLLDGLARVSFRQRFINRGRFAAEVAYRTALPEGANLVELEACIEGECQRGERAEDGAYASARLRDDVAAPAADLGIDGGTATLRVAPVRPDATTEVRWSYVVPLVLGGGYARLRLPPRGNDLRTATSRVLLLPGDYVDGRVMDSPAGTRTTFVESHQAIRLRARVQRARQTERVYRCGDGWCARAYAETALAHRPAGELRVLLDVSPSTRASRRDSLGLLTTALFRSAPAGSRFKATAFAAQAVELLEEWRDRTELPTDLVAQARSRATGPATHLAPALASVQRGEHAVIIGDGTVSDASFEAPEGARISYVAFGDEAVDARIERMVEESDGLLIRWRAEAEEAAAERTLRAQLRLSALTATRVEGMVAGEARTAIRRVAVQRERRRRGADPVSQALAGVTRLSALGGGSDAAPAGEAPEPGASSSTERVRAAIPRGPILRRLRSRIVPAARRCFREERRGRLRHSRRAVYELVLWRGEVASAQVSGTLPEGLERCLEQVADRLEVPYAAGRIRVRYPLYTQAQEAALTIELESDVEDGVDRALERIEIRQGDGRNGYENFLRGETTR
ncbi:MAG: hypothetical protein AAF411_11205 [Myxococcota bacterium]